MEDDIDIYADLPNFNLNLDKKDHFCNCEKLKKEFSLLKKELENIQKIKDNLEKNLSSLLKTARAEITRKDKMINDLRKRLDDITFRRNNKDDSQDFSAHISHQRYVTIEKYENTSLMHLKENETELHKTEFLNYDKHENEKLQYNGQLPTVFAERLHKKIIKDKKEDTKQRIEKLWKFDVVSNLKEISEENIVESDKENGSQSSMNNNSSEFNITRHSDSENLCRKNSGKRMKEEEGTRENKRLKINDNEDKIATDKTDYDCAMQYELKDNFVQYEIKDNLAKFEDRLIAAHPFKEEKISLNKQSTLKHQDMAKQSQNYANWKKEEGSDSRIASTSNHILEVSNDKKNAYRYNSRRSYSRSRNNYESSSSHRLRERSNKMYRNNRKYNDYKYDNQYRIKKDYRLKRDYESMENESRHKTRHKNRKCDDMTWDKSRYLSNDVQDKEGNSLYKNKRCDSHKKKDMAINVLHNKGLHEKDTIMIKMDSQESNCTIINTVNHNAKKIIEHDKIKNESNIKLINLAKNTSICIAKKDSNNLEEGKIVDSPEKKINSVKISTDYKMIENDTKVILIEDKNKDIPVIASITDDKSSPFRNDLIIKQLDNVMDISTKEVETALCFVQKTLKKSGEIVELNSSSKNSLVVNEMQNNNVKDVCKSQCNEDLTDLTSCIGTIEQVCESQCDENLTDSAIYIIETVNQMSDNVDNDSKSRIEKESKISVIDTAIQIEEMVDSNIDIEVRRIDNSNVESVINKNKVNSNTQNSNIKNSVVTEANNNDNSTCKIDNEKSKSSIFEVAERVEAVLNCDITNEDCQVLIGSETSRWISGKSNVEMNRLYLSDHNYVQDSSSVNAFDPNVIRELSKSPKYCDTMSNATILKETKVEEKMNVLLADVKKMMPSMMKNKKNQQSKGIVILRRRRAVMLSDSNASMTVLMNTKTSSNVISNSSNESVLKPRACKVSRAYK